MTNAHSTQRQRRWGAVIPILPHNPHSTIAMDVKMRVPGVIITVAIALRDIQSVNAVRDYVAK